MIAPIPMRWQVIGGLCLINGWRVGAELGVSTGRFTAYLCRIMPECHMIAVDLWQEQPGNTGEGAETYVDRDHEKAYKSFAFMCEAFYPGRVSIMREDTVKAAERVMDASLDFVFIDADHRYENTLADIRAWTPKVRKGGLVSGHDYNWPSVKRAVDETGECRVASDNVWFRLK